ncbi:MAG: hypothetical protein AB1510_02705 [Bacillota bacterium]
MSNKDTKVLGYVAVQPGTINVLCYGDSCIVAGSEKQMREYIAAFSVNPNAEYRISKARYGHVLQAMKLGGVYSFDRESFSRFCPLAREDGIEVVDFTPDNQCMPDGPAISLMRVQWISK